MPKIKKLKQTRKNKKILFFWSLTLVILATLFFYFFQIYKGNQNLLDINLVSEGGDIPNFAKVWKHESNLIGKIGDQKIYRTAIATGAAAYVGAPNYLSPLAFDSKLQKTYFVYPGASPFVTNDLLSKDNYKNMSFNGKNYMGYSGISVNPYIIAYDNKNNTWEPARLLGSVNVLNDVHNYPVVVVDKLGYIHVFYTFHIEERDIVHFISEKPGDISSWKLSSIPNTPRATYGKALVSKSGIIYLFFRYTQRVGGTYGVPGQNPYEWVAYVYSTDNGKTWSQRRPLAYPEKDDWGYNASYIYDMSYDFVRDRVWFVFAATKDHNLAVRNYSVSYLDLSNRKVYSSTQQSLGSSIESSELQSTYYASAPVEWDKTKRDPAPFMPILQYPDGSVAVVSSFLSQDSGKNYLKKDACGEYIYPNRLYLFPQKNYIKGQGVDITDNFVLPNEEFRQIVSARTVKNTRGGIAGYNFVIKVKSKPPVCNGKPYGVRPVTTYLYYVKNLDDLSLAKNSRVNLFEDNTAWADKSGVQNSAFLDVDNSPIFFMFNVPKYNWSYFSSGLDRFMDVEPIGTFYALSVSPLQTKVDGFSADTASRMSRSSISCVSWESVKIGSCTQQMFSQNDSVCNTKNVGVWINLSSRNAQSMRLINVASNVNCEKVSYTDPGWTAWEPFSTYKYWNLDSSNSGKKKICVQFRPYCVNEGCAKATISTPCGAVINYTP